MYIVHVKALRNKMFGRQNRTLTSGYTSRLDCVRVVSSAITMTTTIPIPEYSNTSLFTWKEILRSWSEGRPTQSVHRMIISGTNA